MSDDRKLEEELRYRIKKRLEIRERIERGLDIRGGKESRDIEIPKKEEIELKEWQAYAVVDDSYDSKKYLSQPVIKERIKKKEIIVVPIDSELGKRIRKETGVEHYPICVTYCPSCSPTGWII